MRFGRFAAARPVAASPWSGAALWIACAASRQSSRRGLGRRATAPPARHADKRPEGREASLRLPRGATGLWDAALL